MSILHALVLGLLQGIAEFFPISSSGHLIIFPWMLGWDDFGGDESLKRAFDVALHLGTFVSLVIFFRAEIFEVIKGVLKKQTKAQKLIFNLIIATIPAALIGALLFNEGSTEKIWLVTGLLIVFGVVLGAVDYYSKDEKGLDDFKIKDAILMGLVQAGALWPGVSRSGIIITAGRLRGFNRISAVQISFWMALPILLGAGIYKFIDIGGVSGVPSNMRPAFLAGFLASAVVSFFTLKALIKLLQKISFLPIVTERIVFGFLTLLFLASAFR